MSNHYLITNEGFLYVSALCNDAIDTELKGKQKVKHLSYFLRRIHFKTLKKSLVSKSQKVKMDLFDFLAEKNSPK